MAVLLVLLLASCMAALGFGAAQVPLPAVLEVLTQQAGLGHPAGVASPHAQIVWQLRAPRVVLGALVGAGLALVGGALQAVTRNPLADPHLLGISSGAAVGAVVAVLYAGQALGPLALPALALAGALVGMLLVLALANRHGRLESDRLLLAGVAVAFVMTAAANLLLYLGDPHAASSVMFWMLGGLGAARWELLGLPAVCLALALLALLALAPALNALASGEQVATSLGFDTRRVRWQVFIAASLLTGVLVSLAGAIGFVGLMVPHLARRLVGSGHGRMLPVSALLGALFLVWVDVAARQALAPQDLPIGIATAAIGGVFLMVLLRRA
jgi:iron complex transport system permease protein